MLDINDKLRLITEGHSLDEINSDPKKFTNLVTESFIPVDEISLIFESINVDLDYVIESSIEYLNESALSTIKEKIIKFFNWLMQKIMTIINWIKSKFSKKVETIEEVADRVKEKVKDGKLQDKIDAIKTQNKEKYDALNGHTKGLGSDQFSNKTKSSGSEPGKSEPSSSPKALSMPPKEILKIHVKKKVADGTIPNMSEMATILVQTVTNAVKNVENFRTSITGNEPNWKLDEAKDATKILIKLATKNRVIDYSKLRDFLLGEFLEVEISADDVERSIKLLERLKKEHEEVFKAYQDMRKLLESWKDESIKIIDKHTESGDIKPESITKRTQQAMQLITSGVKILDNLSWHTADALTDCESILKKLDSL